MATVSTQATATLDSAPTDVIPEQTLQSPDTTGVPPDVTSPTSTALTATMLPTQVGVEPSQQPTLLPELTPTLFAEATAQPPVVATLIPSSASFSITPQTVSGDVVAFAISARGLQDVDSITILCTVDPTLLRGSQIWPSGLLTNSAMTLSDDGFQQDGRWIFSAVHVNSTGLNENDTLWVLQYQPTASGYAQMTCRPRLADASGQFMALTESDFSAIVDIPDRFASATPTIIGDGPVSVTDVVPTSTPMPTVNPTSTPTPQATLDATVTPVFSGTTTLSGQVGLSHQAGQVTVTVLGPSFIQIITVNDNEAFSVDVAPGQYEITIDAAHHLARRIPIVVDNDPVMLPVTILIGGDVNDDEIIDMADVNLVAIYLGWLVPDAPAVVDLNSDGEININDLVLVTAHIR